MQQKYLDRAAVVVYLAALGIRTSIPGLQNLASKGHGPKYHVINGRALYTAEALEAWIAAQAARDPHEARRGRPRAAPLPPTTRSARKGRQVAAA